MPEGRTRRPGLGRWAVLVSLVLLVAGCTVSDQVPQNALDPAGPVAADQDALWNLVFPIAVGVFVLVQGLLIYILVKFRRKEGDDTIPPQVAGNTRLEILWTVIPLLILVGIGVPMVGTIFAQAQEPASGERIDVAVVGKQYWWQFEYPDAGVFTANELHIPAGTPIYLHLDGAPEYEGPPDNPDRVQTDQSLVLHSFWVPRLAGKLDYVPGADRFLTIEADEPGTYMGQCAEFCGLSHANMRFTVVAHEPADFDAWLAAQAEPAHDDDAELQGAVAVGFEAWGQHCIGCHAIEGHPANQNARIGPDLTHFASREVFAGGIFDNDDAEALRDWIRNSPEVKPGSQMLPFENLSDEELDGLVEYLQSLE